tara:strand:- start:268 stop:1095 length:828 start_codon:yes stop_codon:yes gene_type:complete
MKVMLFGVHGFLGQHIAKDLRHSDIDVVGITRDQFNIMDINLTVDRLVLTHAPDVIVYAAGINYRFEPTEFTSLAEHNILLALSRFSHKIVYLSSTLVYGSPAHLPITESSPLHPTGTYGFYKLLCEDIVRSCNSWLILRLTSIVSKKKSSSAFSSIYNYLTDNSSPSVLQMRFADTSRDYMHISLCSRLISCLSLRSSNKILNVVSSRSISLSYVFYSMAGLLGITDRRIEFGGSRAEDPSLLEFDNQNIIQVLPKALSVDMCRHAPIHDFLAE